MRLPTLTPVGTAAQDYLDTALSLYRKGHRGDFYLDETVIVMIRDRDIKIIGDYPAYAIFTAQPAATGLYPFFSWFDTDVPTAFPKMSGLMPSMDTFFPVSKGQLTTPYYDHFAVWNVGDDITTATPQVNISFASPILAPSGAILRWHQWMTETQDGGPVLAAATYDLPGLTADLSSVPMQSKLVAYNPDAGALLGEGEVSGLNVIAGKGLAVSGVYYRRVKDVSGEWLAGYQQDGVTNFNGSLAYLSVASDGSINATSLPMPGLPTGSRVVIGEGGVTARHIDYCCDIFTSEFAQHYYVVRLTSDAMADYYYDSFPGGDVVAFSGMSLAVDQYRKADWSLVRTFNLTPSTVDRNLQGIMDEARPGDTIFGNFANQGHPESMGAAYIYACGGLGPSFLPADSPVQPMTWFFPLHGTVLVGSDGTEYPILTAVSCTQDIWNGALLDGTLTPTLSARAAFAANTPNGSGWNIGEFTLFQQAVVLWLGAPDSSPGYRWAGVDAVGMTITQAQPGVENGTPLSVMSAPSQFIGDSTAAMMTLNPFSSGVPVFGVFNASVASATVQLWLDVSVAITVSDGYMFYVNVNGTEYVYAATVADTAGIPSQLSQTVLGANLVTMLNAVPGLSVVMTQVGADGHSRVDPYITKFTVASANGDPINVSASFSRTLPPQSNRQRIVSARIANSQPVLRLESVLPLQTRQVFMYDI